MVSEGPISPEKQLATVLYRLARRDYFCAVSELTGRGKSTVCSITIEVSKVIMDALWDEFAVSFFPHNTAEFNRAILDMEQLWQLNCAFRAVDSCHILTGPVSRDVKL